MVLFITDYYTNKNEKLPYHYLDILVDSRSTPVDIRLHMSMFLGLEETANINRRRFEPDNTFVFLCTPSARRFPLKLEVKSFNN